FQAEDGIRDKLVTGVQTCALPISQAVSPACRFVEKCSINSSGQQAKPPALRGRTSRLCKKHVVSLCASARSSRVSRVRTPRRLRSEERRVGKEGRCWWGRSWCERR